MSESYTTDTNRLHAFEGSENAPAVGGEMQ
jgi:hypothetical protein